MVDMVRLNEVLALAAKHIDQANNNANSSFCLNEAHIRIDNDRADLAARWAFRSLAYSVGINHEDYILVKDNYQDLGLYFV